MAALIFASMCVALLSWGLSSTPMSSPDDDFHLASAWCGLGERSGLCETTGDPQTRLVPAPVAAGACYKYDAGASGECWPADADGMRETARVNTGLYPPVFYGFMSLFASPDVEASVLAMRAANALLAVGAIAAVFYALPRSMRPALEIGRAHV